MTCKAIAEELTAIVQAIRSLDSEIVAKHRDNETIGFIVGLVPLALPAALAVDNSAEAKESLDEKQLRLDQLLALHRLKGCPREK